MNIKIVFNMFYRPFIWLTVRIFLSVPFIGPYIIVVFINKDFALDLFNSILWKNEQISIWFFWDHLIDINLWIQERYYCNWLKFSFRPNFGDFCDMFTPLFCYILYLRNADCCHGYTQKGLYFTLMTIRNQIYGIFSFYKYRHA